MLQNLIVKNYRNLSDLKIDSLSRVNLITGKNNTGKTALLEAIAMYADYDIIRILNHRGEYENRVKKIGEIKDYLSLNLKALSGLFTNRDIELDKGRVIEVGSFQDQEENSLLTLRVIRYIESVSEEAIGNELVVSRKRTILSNENQEKIDGPIKYGFQIVKGAITSLTTLSSNIRTLNPPPKKSELQFIRTNDIRRSENAFLWDKITLTPLEQNIIDSLRIIDSNIERVAFIEGDESRLDRKPVIKLKNDNAIFPLQSMGDGVNRILTLILALVNAKGGYLLIDEFENGLHYSIQEKLWEVIFKTAKELNVQVFATTHSEDCVKAFAKIQNENSGEGQYIRLQNYKGKIEAELYDEKELQIATERDIEPR